MKTDVVVIGGGPSGSMASGLLSKKGFNVVLLDKVRHPRNTVGESLIPHFWRFADMLGATEKIQTEQFVRKAGAISLWNGSFRRTSFKNFGQMRDALHVERDVFDEILLNCSRQHGTQVFEECAVIKVEIGDPSRKQVHYKRKNDGEIGTIECKHIVDASGQSAVVAKQLGFRTFDESLKFMSLWGYFEGGSMVSFSGDVVPIHQRSANTPVTFISTIGEWGWVWHIVLRDKVSVGVILPPDKLKAFKASSEAMEDQFKALIEATPGTRKLLQDATFVPGSLNVIRDYAYKPVNMAVQGCYLAGDAAAFVDPINSAGVSFGMYAGYFSAWCIENALHRPDKQRYYEEMFHEQYRARLSIFRALAIPTDREPTDSEEMMQLLESAMGMQSGPEQKLALATTLLTHRPERIRQVLSRVNIDETQLFTHMAMPEILQNDAMASSALASVKAMSR